MGSVSRVLAGSFNLILNVLIGIFLLNDEPAFKPVYQFMMETCFQPCADRCEGGMSCLMTWVLCNCLTVVLDILLNNQLAIVF